MRADPTRVLERLTSIGLIERMVPVTEDPRRTRRRLYRIADNFLAFWLSIVDRYRAEIDRGLGRSILPVLLRDLDDSVRYAVCAREEVANPAGLLVITAEDVLGR